MSGPLKTNSECSSYCALACSLTPAGGSTADTLGACTAMIAA
jgi:hypothetical protein